MVYKCIKCNGDVIQEQGATGQLNDTALSIVKYFYCQNCKQRYDIITEYDLTETDLSKLNVVPIYYLERK